VDTYSQPLFLSAKISLKFRLVTSINEQSRKSLFFCSISRGKLVLILGILFPFNLWQDFSGTVHSSKKPSSLDEGFILLTQVFLLLAGLEFIEEQALKSALDFFFINLTENFTRKRVYEQAASS
jgi:hypothetical protein